MVNTTETSHEHYHPTVRLCEVQRPPNGCSGFHLSRTKWDPYPWVSGVDVGSPAEQAGLQTGDCVLEVNGEDVLGERINEVASKVRAREDRVQLLLWNAGVDPQCSREDLCCGPMPSNLERLSACLRCILSVLECPVCLDTIPPPAHQCGNGHLICIKCRVRSERCPVCRVRFSRGRSLLADKIFQSMTEAFNLKDEQEESKGTRLRDKLFGKKKQQKLDTPQKSSGGFHLALTPPKNKLLTRIMGKSSSVENLSSSVTLSSLPRPLSNEFINELDLSTNLKAKSFSTGEICRTDSPAVSRPMSRTPSIMSNKSSGLLGIPFAKRPASYHGSSESLNAKIYNDFYHQDFLQGDGSLYHCPYEQDCPSLVKACGVLRHIQEYHEGPLIQYFKPKVTVQIPPPESDTSLTSLCMDGDLFFLRVIADPSSEGDLLVWLWLLGNKKDAESFTLVLNVFQDGCEKRITLEHSVLSLSSTSWSDIVKLRKSAVIKSQTLREKFPSYEQGQQVKMTVEVKMANDDVFCDKD